MNVEQYIESAKMVISGLDMILNVVQQHPNGPFANEFINNCFEVRDSLIKAAAAHDIEVQFIEKETPVDGEKVNFCSFWYFNGKAWHNTTIGLKAHWYD